MERIGRWQDRPHAWRTWATTAVLLAALGVCRAGSDGRSSAATAWTGDPGLQKVIRAALDTALDRLAAQKLEPDQVALTLVDLTHPNRPRRASYRGQARIYPASVVKLFYLVAAQQWLEDGRLQPTAELQRALRDMIVDSSNDATHYVVDVLTDTTAGPELSREAMARWAYKRNAVNRYFSRQGYTNINVNQKPWCEGPYGRERVFVGEHYENRNLLTTDATARLLVEIVLGRAVNAKRSASMMRLLRRNPAKPAPPFTQDNAFIGRGLPPGARLWSKAGWTSTVRHDAAYVELPDGRRFVLVIFTTGHSREREIIPTLARAVRIAWPAASGAPSRHAAPHP